MVGRWCGVVGERGSGRELALGGRTEWKGGGVVDGVVRCWWRRRWLVLSRCFPGCVRLRHRGRVVRRLLPLLLSSSSSSPSFKAS